jgi:hypothetical protein
MLDFIAITFPLILHVRLPVNKKGKAIFEITR